ncbi:hypothetical protein Rsub_04012 [Raphidocelis subcapitata]|uniref:Tyrosine-protein kinase ephrin type A/B receptor-like domain-containing protein n=1 Tax=Raphidocelis subcapitata TaxID=307507 RepID=A0A2V0NVN7_9CHLO|nr:hypothetical protein Rsub_04012 [Raphidocelis subcapitata]|eukprot:GBF91708.1 hypothetical protein Rsub_04012 [Raphidocelis subcapitata]
MSRSILALVLALALAQAVTAELPPMTLPSFVLPNATAIIEGAKASLKSAATAAAVNANTVRPFKCLNGKPLVTCLFDVCPKGSCENNQACIPDYCGQCGHKCVNVTIPPFDVKLPSLPGASIKANLSAISVLPKPPCGPNQVVNISAMVTSLFLKNPKVACQSCPEGTVALYPSLACTVCPPGTFAAAGVCRKCFAGTASAAFGAKACTACAAGSFAPLPGSLVCLPCPKGFAADASGASKCDFQGFAA